MAVTKKLQDSENGDVKVIEPGYGGSGADIISVLNQAGSQQYDIRTYGGSDTINLSTAGADNEIAIYSGAGQDKVTGSSGDDTAYDGANNDVYKMGAGSDLIIGGAGNDTYDGGTGSGDGLRFIYAPSDLSTTTFNTKSIKLDLLLKTRQDLGVFGKDVILNFEHIAGGNGADKFYGTNGANQLFGRGGSDILYGRKGADLLEGGAGKDTLVGGGGADKFEMLESAAARDKIKYTSVLDSASTSTTGSSYTKYDQINFFDVGLEATADRIDLSSFAGTFSFTDGLTFSANSTKEVRVDISRNVGGSSNHDSIIYIDTDSDRAAEMRIYVMDVDLHKYDFIL